MCGFLNIALLLILLYILFFYRCESFDEDSLQRASAAKAKKAVKEAAKAAARGEAAVSFAGDTVFGEQEDRPVDGEDDPEMFDELFDALLLVATYATL